MATIDETLKSGVLCKYQLTTWETSQPLRSVLHHPDFFENWADTHPVLADVQRGAGGLSRLEHLEIMLNEFACSRRPSAGNLRRMKPNHLGVFRFSPFKLRIFGFFTREGDFVAIYGATEEETKKDKKLVDKLTKKVGEFIAKNKLKDEVAKGEIYEVIKTSTK